jgi:Protein of Unknown function (DUF2784)
VNLDSLLASVTLGLHVAFIVFVVFGAAWTRCRPLLRWLHIGALAWSIVVEIGPWPCPLTVAENWLETRAGRSAYTNGFLLHYLDRIVYPNIPPNLLSVAALLVVAVNVAIYVRRFRQRHVERCW